MEFKQKERSNPSLREKVILEIKRQQSQIIARSHWGRSTLYKKLIHSAIVGITVVVFATGLNARVSLSADSKITYEGVIEYQNVDTLQQGAFVETQITVSGSLNFSVNEYVVQPGDSVQAIADMFAVSKDTIKWANPKIDYYSEGLDAGDKLVIPEIDGVLYQVQEGDTVDSVLTKTSGDRFQVIEVNQLLAPEFKLTPTSLILIPGGKLDIPPKPVPVQQSATYYYYTGPAVDVSVLAGISFINPMGACGGYSISRGYLPWHNGVDLSGAHGCPILAVASGVIDYIGWSNWGEGNMVRIYHGNGVYTSYYHGSGFGAFSVGQSVNQGDVIMYEGSTGNSTGPHLHFGLRLGGYDFIDPSPYVPY